METGGATPVLGVGPRTPRAQHRFPLHPRCCAFGRVVPHVPALWPHPLGGLAPTPSACLPPQAGRKVTGPCAQAGQGRAGGGAGPTREGPRGLEGLAFCTNEGGYALGAAECTNQTRPQVAKPRLRHSSTERQGWSAVGSRAARLPGGPNPARVGFSSGVWLVSCPPALPSPQINKYLLGQRTPRGAGPCAPRRDR